MMSIQPKVKKPIASFFTKKCARCKDELPPESFIRVKSPFFVDGYSNICAACLDEMAHDKEDNWQYIDRICQWLDIPFVPAEFERIKALAGERVLQTYAEIFLDSEYEYLGWDEYFQRFKELQASGRIEDELPEIRDKRIEELQKKWGANYDLESLEYLEQLYDGMLLSQNINGALQVDQAKKVCKISAELDSRIRSGQDFDKMLTAYDRLVKTAEFTPKNTKNASDFDSVGEVIRWLEKRGWVNGYYTGVTQDIVDETIKNIQAYNRSLYTNESGIGEEITRRIEALKNAHDLENTYTDFNQEYDSDQYEVDGYDDLMDEDFVADGEFDVGV